jgi:hypothetical protein
MIDTKLIHNNQKIETAGSRAMEKFTDNIAIAIRKRPKANAKLKIPTNVNSRRIFSSNLSDETCEKLPMANKT